jgi:hypothetical protein
MISASRQRRFAQGFRPRRARQGRNRSHQWPRCWPKKAPISVKASFVSGRVSSN